MDGEVELLGADRGAGGAPQCSYPSVARRSARVRCARWLAYPGRQLLCALAHLACWLGPGHRAQTRARRPQARRVSCHRSPLPPGRALVPQGPRDPAGRDPGQRGHAARARTPLDCLTAREPVAQVRPRAGARQGRISAGRRAASLHPPARHLQWHGQDRGGPPSRSGRASLDHARPRRQAPGARARSTCPSHDRRFRGIRCRGRDPSQFGRRMPSR